MTSQNLEIFLDYGWYNETILYYNGWAYWFEGDWDEKRDKVFHSFVYKYPAEIVENTENIYVKALLNEKGERYSIDVFDIFTNTSDEAKETLLKAKIFDGKSFWEVENELEWYEGWD